MHHMDDDKNAQLYQALCTGLPSPIVGAEQPKSLLLVFLADFDDIHEKKLVDHLQPSASEFKILTWHPRHRVLQSLAPQRQHRDSKANLYGLAIVAHRNGHSGFLVADELTKRQVEGRFPLRGEDERISVGMIAVRQSKEQDGQLRVIAKRSAMANEENLALLAAVDNFEIFPDFENPQRVERVTTIYSVLGLQLHDPDRPVFTPGTANPMGYEEVSSAAMGTISMNTPLPPELALDVTSRAEKNLEEPINFPPGLNFQDSKRDINVLLGFKSTESERSSILTALKSAVHHEFEKKSGKQKKGVKRKAAAKQENINTRGGDGPLVTSDTSHETQHEPSVHLIP